MGMNRRLLMVATMMGLLTASAVASDAVLLHAAGSLRGALTEVSRAFEASSQLKVQAKFGASGLLEDEIAAGARAEVFASANMAHPQALRAADRAYLLRGGARIAEGPVQQILTRERLEALYGAPVHMITDATGTAFIPG
jgi:hypothetical protein